MSIESAGGRDAATRPKLLQQVRIGIRRRHYSRRTEEAYVHWIRRYVRFHGLRHPAEMGRDMERPRAIIRAKTPKRLPVVLTAGEVARVLSFAEGRATAIVSPCCPSRSNPG